MKSWKRIIVGLIGVLVSLILIWFGISWATGDVTLTQSVLLGSALALGGLIRLAAAARQLFASVDQPETPSARQDNRDEHDRDARRR